MKLKNDIVQKINNVPVRRRLGEKLNIGDQMLYHHLRVNREDGCLTRMTALVFIAQEVGLKVDELLETGTEVS